MAYALKNLKQSGSSPTHNRQVAQALVRSKQVHEVPQELSSDTQRMRHKSMGAQKPSPPRAITDARQENKHNWPDCLLTPKHFGQCGCNKLFNS